MKQSESGFTLIELLVTLSIMMVISLISGVFIVNSFDKQMENQFFTLFEQDVLLIQNDKFRKYHNSQIVLREDSYAIFTDLHKDMSTKRTFSEHISIMDTNMKFIRFSQSGTTIAPGTLLIRVKNKTYSLVFPFGKGRYYVAE